VKHSRNARNERGVALLTVITALVALMVIAVPFAITMRMGYERSRAHNARTRAQHQVDSIMRFLEAYLVRTTERVELENRAADRKVANADPEVDTPAEFTPTLSEIALALGNTEAELQDAYGTIVGWEVDDENGKLNLNSASFFALGNLLGLSVLGEELSEGGREITLEDATAFPDKGLVKIGRELVKYGGKEGNRLVDCERGIAAGESEHGKAEKYNQGHWVVNYAAWAISHYGVARHPGEYTVFENLDVSDITRLSDKLPDAAPVLTKADWERVRPYVTVWSKGEIADGWANVQPVAEGTSLPSDENDHDIFTFANSYYYNTGTIIRLSEKAETNVERDEPTLRKKTIRPRRRDYSMVFDAQPSGRFESQMELFAKVHREFDGNQSRVEYRTRHPINVNTAPREVLLAILTHLQLRGQESSRVTPEAARGVVDAIVQRREGDTPLRSMEDLKNLLTRLVDRNTINVSQREAIYRNCLNSNDQGLAFGTAPVTFRTFDVYTLRATATISNEGGQLAKHSSTRVVEVGSQLTTSKTWETQRDFEEQLVASQNPRYWTSAPVNTGEFFASHIEPWPRWPKQLRRHQFPWDPYGDERGDAKRSRYFRSTTGETNEAVNGDIRLQPARAEFDTAFSDATFVEHFDREELVEGRFVEGGYTDNMGDGGSIVDTISNGHVQPFAIQFWWQPAASPNSSPVLFDYGESDFRNRYTCYIDSSANQLVFAVSDNTAINRSAEIRYDLSEQGGIVQDVWYHIHCVAAGCHPSKMALIVDGRAVGKSNVLTHLTNDLTTDSGSVPVEDASGFPETGAVLVGNEVVEYSQASGNELIVRTDPDGNVIGRGTRGTLAEDHPQDTTVVLFGYSRPIVKGLKRGGATVDGDMGEWTPISVDNTAGGEDQFSTYEPLQTPYSHTLEAPGGAAAPPAGGALAANLLQGGGGGETPPTMLTIYTLRFEAGQITGFPLRPYGADQPEGTTVEDQLEAFQETGYALIAYIGGTNDNFENFVDGGRDSCRGVVEFVSYTKSGDSLTLERLDDNHGSQCAPERDDQWEILLGYSKTGGTITDGIIGAPFVIVPVSVRTSETNSSSYWNPTEDDDLTHWVAQILQESGGDGLDVWEWIRYCEILSRDSFSYFLQCRVPNEALWWDTILAPGFDDAFLDLMLNVIDGGGEDPGGDPGTDPGGDPPDDGDGGGGGPVEDPNDPPDAPPADGGGGNPDPGDPGDTEDPAPDDGPGGNPDPEDPGDTEDPAPDEGPGGNPDPEDPGDTEDPAPGEGDGGNPDPEDPGDTEDPAPDEGGGGNPLPPSEGGDDAPDPGDNDPPPDPSDDPEPNEEPVEPDVEADEEGIFLNAATEAVAQLIGFRGMQSDRDSDGVRDDWWPGTVPDGALVIPVAACYPGPEPANAAPLGIVTEGSEGEDTGSRFSVNPLLGRGDKITMVTGDDEQSEGEDLTCFWSLPSTYRRLYDATEFGSGGDEAPWDLDVFAHLFALTRATDAEYPRSDNVQFRRTDYRRYNRVLAFPSGEMPDNTQNLVRPRIGASFDGDPFPCILDEILGDERIPLFRLSLVDESINEDTDTFLVISEEGTPAESDVPEAPGVLRIGEELVVYGDADIDGGRLRFSECRRGVMRTTPRSYERGAPVEVLFGIHVAVLTDASADSSNTMTGNGFRRFPRRFGCVRLESPEGAELRIYTVNQGNALICPQGDIGAAIFNGRYGSGARSHEAGTPVFWQPVRTLDLFAEFSDDPHLSFFSISTQLNGAFVKRFYWEEGQLPPRTNIRAIARLDEAIDWNAQLQSILYLSRDGDSAGDVDIYRRRKGDDPRTYLRAMEDPQGDNLFNLQADKIEVRFFVVYESNAFTWENPAEIGWKSSPRIESASLEYAQQNLTRSHIDSIR